MDLERVMASTWGYSQSEWDSTRDWVGRRLRRVAKAGGTITYGALCREMQADHMLSLEPHSSALAGLLGQVNVLEYEAARPLLSSVVVQADDPVPGDGFWRFVRVLGIDPGSSEQARLRFWVEELNRCHSFWASAS